MKCLDMNKTPDALETMCGKYHCYLLHSCHFTPEDRENKDHEYDEVRDYILS